MSHYPANVHMGKGKFNKLFKKKISNMHEASEKLESTDKCRLAVTLNESQDFQVTQYLFNVR
jgi:hypothetical protein